jgi:ADP-dependent NAD(P)H-hydrate dehydratase / NAD(P)H-hydrate epimerase
MKLVTVEEMRRLESEADATGVSYANMMELAGQAVAEAIAKQHDLAKATVLILVGKGNNGGDGLVTARALHEAGATVKVYCLQPPDEADSKVIALREGSVFMVDAENDLQSRVLKHLTNSATVIVDAVFGTGVRLPLTGKAAQVLGLVKRQLEANHNEGKPHPYIVAVDVPSGVDSDTGAVDADTLVADLTVTFGLPKVGQYLFPAADYVGELRVAPIGWPGNLATLANPQLELAEQSRVQAALPKRGRDSHKYDFGRLLVVAGSKNYVGAAYLVGAAAARSGAGLITLAVPAPVQAMLAPQLVEATWLPLADEDGAISKEAAPQIAKGLGKVNAIAIGPGLGLAETTQAFLAALLESIRQSSIKHVLVDADGLRLLAKLDHWPELLPKPTVLTPHPGEMQALTGLETEAIQKDRLNIARKYAKEWGHIVLLKGAYTVIAAPDGRAVIEPFATPALAKAGSGDVLSGIIGSLLAQGMEPFEAAVAGAFVHGRAGETVANELGTTVSITARDYVGALAKVFATLVPNA